MPLEIVTVPCLADNYAFLVHDPASGATALVDAPEAAPVEAALAARGWQLTEIWLTHHHWDHIDAVDDLQKKHAPRLLGAAADSHRLPPLNKALQDDESFDFAGHAVKVMDVSGHTLGHVAFYIASAEAVFTADSLMALGCGRLFEGTAAQMWHSLSKLAALPPETVVYSGHEYTASNAKFALTIEPDNAALRARAAAITLARENGQATVPSTLAVELATNPFMRAGLPSLKSHLDMAEQTDDAVFAEIRNRKDSF